jgi:hypothetical protein
MTTQAITNFIRITDKAGVVQGRYQNGKVGEVITLDGEDYSYLSFLYRGATRNRTGDNLEAELILASNRLAMSIGAQAVQRKWYARVTTCTMHPRTFAVGRKLTRDTWLAASMSYDPEQLTVLLSSGIDAVGANAPTRCLTSDLVGQLPSTSAISNRAWIGALLLGPLLLSILGAVCI